MATLGTIAKGFRLGFVRIFGSAVRNRQRARDIDLVVGPRLLAPDEREALADALAVHFGKKVDLVQLRSGLNPALIAEIGAGSRPLFESKNGRADYAVLIDRLLAIAEDERLSFPPKLRAEAARRAERRLRVS